MVRFLTILTALLFAAPINPAPPAAGDHPFVVDELLVGVWLFRAPEHPASHTNSLVIERDTGLLVVESQPSPESAQDLLRAIGEVSSKPVTYLLLTHAHVESSGGASAFPESTLVISSRVTSEALQDEARDLAGETRSRSGNPDVWGAPPRVRPDLLISSGTQLADGKHLVEMLPLQGGHCPGSLIVRIADAGFYYVGSTIAPDRNPFAEVGHSNIRAWVNSLNSLSLQRPKVIVPLRGKVLDAETLRKFRDSLVWVVGQVEDAFIEGIDSEEVISYAMDSPRLGEYFDMGADPSFVATLFETARQDALAQRHKREIAP